MIPVSKEQFFAAIFRDKLDVHPRFVTEWPYTSLWEFHRQIGRPVYGKSVVREERGRITTDYYLAKATQEG